MRDDGLPLMSERTAPTRTKARVAGLLCVLFTAAAITFVILYARSSSEPIVGKSFGFADQFNSTLAPKFAGVAWVPGTNSYIAEENKDIVLYTLVADQNGTGTRSILALSTDLKDPITHGALEYSNYVLSADGQSLLFQTRREKVYRHSSTAVYFAYSIADKSFTAIADANPVQACQWSPVGHSQLAYVRDNNLYVFTVETAASVNVTHDGRRNHVINGVNDWVYEEEVLGQSEAFWWSPDGKFVSFLRFEESDVKEYQFPIYQMPYNQEYVFKYPKSGQNNSAVTMLIYNVETRNLTQAQVGGGGGEHYFIEVTYFGVNTLAMRIMPRLQNSWTIWTVDLHTGDAKALRTQTHEQYLEPSGMLTYITKTHQFIDLIIHDDFNHLELFDATTGASVRVLTSGQWQVDALFAINEDLELIYYSSTQPSSIERALYAVSLSGGTPVHMVPREKKGQRTFQSASFTTTGAYFVLNEASDMPSSSLFSAGDDGRTARVLAVLQDNAVMRAALSAFALPTQDFGTLARASDKTGTPMNMFRILPPGFKDDGSVKYHVLLNVYGGPGAQMIQAKATIGAGNGFHTFLSSNHRYIIWSVDAIGTGYRGDKYQKATTYMNLGVHEARDVVGVIAHLKTLPYVNPDRIALWGWSYGGFLTSSVAAQGDSGLQTAIAVAPVADWALYDSIYTERYMRTPENNAAGYYNSSVLNRVANIKSVPNYMLVHGTGDDNVHFQNGAMLAKGLIEADVQFSTMFYPNRDHSLRGPKGETNRHLYRMLTDYLLRTMP